LSTLNNYNSSIKTHGVEKINESASWVFGRFLDLAGFSLDIEVKCILRLLTIAPITEKSIKIESIPALPKPNRNKIFEQRKIDN
jgi:hypothetical protein